MQRQRGELVPIGEALADLGGPIQALRETPPPARRGFTLADQVNQLVSASEADADLGFMARTMALCSLPRSNPGNRKEYKRVNGPFTLYMVAGGGNKLPYGNLPRLLAQNQSSRHGPPSGGPDFQRPSNRAPATRVGVSKSLLGRCLCGFEASRTRRASTTSARRDRARPGVVSCSRFSSGATRNGEMRRQIGW